KGLEGASHHAVIPNVNMVDDLREIWPRLSIDEKKLFDVIARAYLAAVMPDFRYRQTTATLDVRGFDEVLIGKQEMVGAIDAVCNVAQRIIGKLTEGAGAGGPSFLPSLWGSPAGGLVRGLSRRPDPR